MELTAEGVTISVSGFVDRVDGWVENGRLHLRVVDYKTGRKSFDLTEVWNGLGLQMLLYLFALEEAGRGVLRTAGRGGGCFTYLPGTRWSGQPDHERGGAAEGSGQRAGPPGIGPLRWGGAGGHGAARAGGYRFLPLRVSKSTGEITGEALVSAERLGRLEKHTRKVLEEICRELAAGNIAADPFWRGPEKNACRFCDYAAACHFEEGRGGDCRRWLPGVKAQEFWENVERETD